MDSAARKETAVSGEDALVQTLQNIWKDVCQTYDVIAPRPQAATLFANTSLIRPYDAAQSVLVNMLLEVIENIDRFTPWYTKPARLFGLETHVNQASNRVDWHLTTDGCDQWWGHIDLLAAVIEKNANLIRAMVLVDSLITAVSLDNSRILAQCHCVPACFIHVKQSILQNTAIVCDLCQQPFSPTDDYSNMGDQKSHSK